MTKMKFYWRCKHCGYIATCDIKNCFDSLKQSHVEAEERKAVKNGVL